MQCRERRECLLFGPVICRCRHPALRFSYSALHTNAALQDRSRCNPSQDRRRSCTCLRDGSRSWHLQLMTDCSPSLLAGSLKSHRKRKTEQCPKTIGLNEERRSPSKRFANSRLVTSTQFQVQGDGIRMKLN